LAEFERDNRRGTAGSRPRSIRSSIKACITALCSVAEGRAGLPEE
jgi:hypothetical protein